MPVRAKLPCPTEAEEQATLFSWLQMQSVHHPELRLAYHVPNEGQRAARTGARMRREGLRKGVPDICLPVPRGGYHGLYIELKRLHGGTVSREQKEWLQALREQGYAAHVCKGWTSAAAVIREYLEMDREVSEAIDRKVNRLAERLEGKK